MNGAPTPPPYRLHFLTDAWVWEQDIDAATAAEATAMARDALEVVVQEERPELACVTVMQGDRKLGVWDRIADQYVWTDGP